MIEIDPRIQRWLKYRYLRYKVRSNKTRDAREFAKLSPKQRLIVNCFIQALYNPNVELSVNRTPGSSYIQIPNENFFAKLEFKELTVINTVYYYNIDIPEYQYYRLLNLYDKKLDHIRTTWDSKINLNTTKSLEKIEAHLKESRYNNKKIINNEPSNK